MPPMKSVKKKTPALKERMGTLPAPVIKKTWNNAITKENYTKKNIVIFFIISYVKVSRA